MVAITDNWDIRYSDYVGDLVLFDQKIGKTNRSELRTDVDDHATVTYIRKTNTPVMVEIPNANKVIKNIGALSKHDVITKAKEYINA